MAFKAEPCVLGESPVLEQSSGESWTPLFWHSCSFPPEIFAQVMQNLIRNPNINSTKLFRADISLDRPFTESPFHDVEIPPRIIHIKGFNLKQVMVRTMIPRNVQLDKPLDQTCLIYEKTLPEGEIQSLVIYLPHVSSAAETPFYHPAVYGIAFLHTYSPLSKQGNIAIHYSFFENEPKDEKVIRTAGHLLQVLHKHGQGTAAGYVKRVQHDVIVPQTVSQNIYSRLKSKYAKSLIDSWAEVTDPSKHVFEDLSIAAFLMGLWDDMYKDTPFPGFVDIGCGNGLLVHILIEEGYSGWGFDARRRKSWATYGSKTRENLQELVLVPSKIQTEFSTGDIMDGKSNGPGVHNGIFPDGTFIISNHADELTPWTPILANISRSPYIMIPCCSHDLTGARFRAPQPKGPAKTSAYASLVVWVSKIAKECGWEVEKEMMRIPSTRNTALIGRRREIPFEDVDIDMLIQGYGGAAGWEENAMKLVKGATRGH
ncbi:hypothetical protein BP6252_04809 [Coleophoma cylindrospora]|uniref:tRNA (uracil-O(2)-)-methyltransferase n=1 Tax=Coleophoma cylindrospora TaxID=1849047 RepID=A0A3D8S243_9HELO|nr:hypothetical protein BP6252_04809 [Coleophoma cylindrospora]